MRGFTRVMHSHKSVRINQDISAELTPMLPWFSRTLPTENQQKVTKNGHEPVNGRPAPSLKSIAAVKRTIAIDQQWPL